MPAEVHALVFALVREHLKNRGFKEAAAAFKEEYGAGSGGISSLKTLCAELNVTEQHRGRRRAGLKGSVMMSLLEKIFSKSSERHLKPHKNSFYIHLRNLARNSGQFYSTALDTSYVNIDQCLDIC